MTGMPGRVFRGLVALPVLGFSLALMLRAGMGMSPFDVVFTGVAHSFSISLGLANVLVSIAVVALAWVLGQRPGPMTVIIAVAVGPFLELALHVIDTPGPLIARIAFFALGTVGLAASAVLCITARLGVGPPEAIMLALMGRGVGLVVARVSYELAAVGIGFLLGGAVGVGTIVFALTIGPLIRGGLALVGHRELADPVVAGDAPA